MEREFHYGTVTEAIKAFKEQGFTTDFNLKENTIVAGDEEFSPDDFQIMDVYRYEGESDPADESSVYAILTKTGLKGILVMGYGNNSDNLSSPLLRKMHY